MEDDEAWLYGDDPSAEASAVVDVKKEDDVSISERHNFRYNIAGIISLTAGNLYKYVSIFVVTWVTNLYSILGK